MAELRVELAELRVEVRDEFATLYKKLGDMTRSILIVMVMLWASGIACAFAAARLAS